MPRQNAPRPVKDPPTDDEVIDAINEHAYATQVYREAQEALQEARTRLVDVLRRRGVTGFSSL